MVKCSIFANLQCHIGREVPGRAAKPRRLTYLARCRKQSFDLLKVAFAMCCAALQESAEANCTILGVIAASLPRLVGKLLEKVRPTMMQPLQNL